MFPKYDGARFTAKQIFHFLLASKSHNLVLAELSETIQGRRVLLCGAGKSLKELELLAPDFDIIVGMNGLIREKELSHHFDYFFIEDRAAYDNYIRDDSPNKKIVTVAGMPGSHDRQLNFIHQYGFPRYLKKPMLGESGKCFFWGGSVAYFAINVMLCCRASGIGVLGVDLLSIDAYANPSYHNKDDRILPPDFALARYCLKSLFFDALVKFPSTVITDLGYGQIFD